MATRTGLYIRLSHITGIERGSSSIPAQLARLKSDTEAAGETVVGTFVEEAKSATSTKRRSEYQRLMQWVREGRIDKVRIEDVDRGHRNELERRQFEEELQKYRVVLQYSGEQEQMSPAMRQFQRSVKGALAEMESGLNSARTYKRKKYLVSKRKWQGGNTQYGLRTDGRGWLEHDPETYPILLWILERRAQGIGYKILTKSLNQGISLNGEPLWRPNPPYMRLWQRKPTAVWQDPETGEVEEVEKPIPNTDWNLMTVRHICRGAVDGIYAGVWKWGRSWGKYAQDGEGQQKEEQRVEFDPFVPIELIERVRAVEGDKNRYRRRAAKYNSYLLRPTCALCGGAMSGAASHTKYLPDGSKTALRRYRCVGQATAAGTCRMRDVDADFIEAYVVERIKEHLQVVSPTDLSAAVERVANQRRSTLERALIEADKLITEAERRKQAAEETLERLVGKISERLEQEYIKRAENALREIDELLDERKQVEAGLLRLTDNLADLRRNVLAPLETTDLWTDKEKREELRRLLGLLLRTVVIHEAPVRSSKPMNIEVEFAEVEELLS